MVMAVQTLPVAKSATTLENFMAAYNGESNAQAHYLEYAKKAKAEGYPRVGKLFIAIAASEGIHAAKHAKMIVALKGAPKVTLVKAKIGTTRENLEAALAGETAEIEKIYPEFIKQAELEKKTDAVRSFGGAKAIETIHTTWFKLALADLSKWKTQGEFYTCQVCGNVVDKLDFEYCPICKAPISEFVQAK
jgi:rubrerythrin